MDNYHLNNEAISFILEEIPDGNDLTDIESDDEPDVRLTDASNFDRIFQRGISDFVNSQHLEYIQSEEDFEKELDDNNESLTHNVDLNDLDQPSGSTISCKNISEFSGNIQETITEEVKIKNNKQSKLSKPNLKNKATKPKGKMKPTEPDRQWRKTETTTNIPEFKGKYPGPVEGVFDTCQTQTDVFKKTIEPIIDLIVFQSNLYATQQGKTLNMDRNEFLSFIGINFMMGYNVQPSWKNYWSTSPDLGCQIIANTMSRNRFDTILNNIHVNDNLLKPTDCHDKLYKIRPMIDSLNNKFIQIYNVNREVSVDESMIIFKGRSTIKQYNAMKPIKRGYKLWCLADKKGFISQFEIYQGKHGKNPIDENEYNNFGQREQVVLRLTKPYWGTEIKVYFDNYYTSLKLLEKLLVENVLACGTIQKNRVGLPSLQDEKKLIRGNFDFRVSNLGITVFEWMDNRVVWFASNFHGSEKTTVKRTNREGEKMDISCPEIVRDYNMHMGGVDCADQLRQYYNVNRRSRKWWHRLFWGLIDISFVNSYVIYSYLFKDEKITLLEYRRNVAQGLMTLRKKDDTPKRKKSSEKVAPQPKRGKKGWSVPNDVRLGNRGVHFIEFGDKRGRCEVCSLNKIESRPYSYCAMCKVFLCIISNKNCFKVFHDL